MKDWKIDYNNESTRRNAYHKQVGFQRDVMKGEPILRILMLRILAKLPDDQLGEFRSRVDDLLNNKAVMVGIQMLYALLTVVTLGLFPVFYTLTQGRGPFVSMEKKFYRLKIGLKREDKRYDEAKIDKPKIWEELLRDFENPKKHRVAYRERLSEVLRDPIVVDQVNRFLDFLHDDELNELETFLLRVDGNITYQHSLYALYMLLSVVTLGAFALIYWAKVGVPAFGHKSASGQLNKAWSNVFLQESQYKRDENTWKRLDERNPSWAERRREDHEFKTFVEKTEVMMKEMRVEAEEFRQREAENLEVVQNGDLEEDDYATPGAKT